MNIDINKIFSEGAIGKIPNLAENIPGFPNCRFPGSRCHCLEYAIYHSPVPFIKELLERGINPNYEDHSGFPSIMAALSSKREDRIEIIELLLAYGADVNDRGINDWTPLHWAAANDSPELVLLLLEKKADPTLRTRIDNKSTPLEEAIILGSTRAVEILETI